MYYTAEGDSAGRKWPVAITQSSEIAPATVCHLAASASTPSSRSMPRQKTQGPLIWPAACVTPIIPMSSRSSSREDSSVLYRIHTREHTHLVERPCIGKATLPYFIDRSLCCSFIGTGRVRTYGEDRTPPHTRLSRTGQSASSVTKVRGCNLT